MGNRREKASDIRGSPPHPGLFYVGAWSLHFDLVSIWRKERLMLIFSRNAGEDFYIGDNVRVVILACDRRGRVRLGVEGPRDVAIARGELVRDAHRSCDADASTGENKRSA